MSSNATIDVVIRCGTPAHRMKTGMSIIFPDTRHKSVTLATSIEQLESFIIKATYPSIFIQSLPETNPGILIKITDMCFHHNFLQTQRNISRIYCTIVYEIFKRCREFIDGLSMCNGLTIFSTVYKCQHKQ